MNPIKRRMFLKSGLAASALGFPALGQVRGANDRVQVALIGCGGRGTQVTASMARRSAVECSQVGGGRAADYKSTHEMYPTMQVPSAPYLDLATAVKDRIDLPVFHAPRITDAAPAAHEGSRGYRRDGPPLARKLRAARG